MKTIDAYLNELPEPERTLCLEARAKAKKRMPGRFHDAEPAEDMAEAIMFGFYWIEDGGDHDKFSAIYDREAAGEFDKAAPKKMAADPLAERMEAMCTDIMDRLEALRMGQMDQDVSETLNRIEGSVNSHGSAIAMAQGHIVQRLTALESSVAVIRSGATFMQQLEQDAPKGLQDGDYTENAEGLEDELIAMGLKWWVPCEGEGDSGAYIDWDGVDKDWYYRDSRSTTHLDHSTFLSRARVTAQELGPEVWVPKIKITIKMDGGKGERVIFGND